MAEKRVLVLYAGRYPDVDAARSDFEAVKAAHKAQWIGFYESALFSRDDDSKVRVIDIDATTRGDGAKVGVVTGAIFGVLFPPSVLASAVVGAATGAGIGNFVKPVPGSAIKEYAEDLKPGEAGLILVAEAAVEVPTEELMAGATMVAAQEIEATPEELHAAIEGTA